MTTQRTQTQLNSFFLFAVATLAALIVSMWQVGTASAQDNPPMISVNDIFPAQGEVVTITLTGFPAEQYVHVDFGHPAPYNEVNVFINADGLGETTHAYDCGTFQIRAWPLDDPSQVSSTWIFPCGGPPTGDAEITASNYFPAAGEVVTFTLYGFPRNAWIHVDFGGDGSPEEKEVNVFTDGMGGATTTHTYPCDHSDYVTAWPLSDPNQIVMSWRLIYSADCPVELIYELTEDIYEDGTSAVFVSFRGEPFTGPAGIWYTTLKNPSVIVKTTVEECFCYGLWYPVPDVQESGGRVISLQIPDTRYPLSTTAAGWHIELGWFVRDGYTVATKTPEITGPSEVMAGWPVTFELTGEPGFTVTVDFGHASEPAKISLDSEGRGQVTHEFPVGTWTIAVMGGNSIVVTAEGVAPHITGPTLAKAGEPVIFTVTGTPLTWVTVTFGDGEQTSVFINHAGSNTTHTYPVGTWTVAVEGGNALTLEVTADGNPPIPTQRIFLPLVTS